MNSKKTMLLNQWEFTFLLVGFLIGAGFFKLPNILIKEAKQDAYIAAILGLSYPIYIVLTGLYISIKNPNDNILAVSRNTFGKLFGTFLNFIYFMQFVITVIVISSDSIQISRTYIVAFLTPIKVVIMIALLVVYTALKDIKTLGKVSLITSYLFILVIFFSIAAIPRGSMLNIQPVFGSGWKSIFNAAILTSYYYMGFEAIPLYHTFVESKKALKKACFFSLLICSLIWVWIVFICIYYLGIYVVPKSLWALIFVFESIHMPIINNFLFFFMAAWSLNFVKSISNYYHATGYILEDITGIKAKIIILIFIPMVSYLSIKFLDESIKKAIVSTVLPILAIFNILYFSVLAAASKIKSSKNNKG